VTLGVVFQAVPTGDISMRTISNTGSMAVRPSCRISSTLCRAHHRLVHEGGIAVEALAGGGWRFRRPDGREFASGREKSAHVHDWTALRDSHTAHSIVIDETTAATRWRGERMDYELGVWVLCAQAERARNGGVPRRTASVSAETHVVQNCDAVD